MDPYKILGIEKDASPDEIRRAYRSKAAKFHPDKDGEAWIFQQIQDAYDELTGKRTKKQSRKKPDSSQEKKKEAPNADDPFNPDAPFGDDPFSGQRSYSQSSPFDRAKPKRRPKRNKPFSKKSIFGIGGSVVFVVILILGIVLWKTNDSETLANNINYDNDSEQPIENRTGTKRDMSSDGEAKEAPSLDLVSDRKNEAEHPVDFGTATTSDAPDVKSNHSDPEPPNPSDFVENDATNDPAFTDPAITTVENYEDENENVFVLFDRRDPDTWFIQKESDDEVTSTFTIYPNGEISADGKGFTVLWTNESFSDFVLELEWRLFKRRRQTDQGSGIFVRTNGKEKGLGLPDAYIEIQISENESGDFYVFPLNTLKTDPIQKARRPRRHKHYLDAAHPIGRWNKFKIICQGDQIDVFLNGKLVNSGREVRLTSGRIGLAFQDNKVNFRNVILTKLPE